LVLQLCCLVLLHGCPVHDEFSKVFEGLGGFTLLTQAIRRFPEEKILLARSLDVLCAFCREGVELLDDEVLVRAIFDAVRAMKTFADSQTVCLAACRFLFEMCVAHVENQRLVVESGGRSAIVHVLKMHVTNSKLTYVAARTLLAVQYVRLSS
jgi:hypothetical protein